MTFETGLAPNPFGRWCTLAVCTPNHCNAQLEIGDWIVGHSEINECNKLIYPNQENGYENLMEVDLTKIKIPQYVKI